MLVRRYDPHMLELLHLASTSELRVKLSSYKAVSSMRARLNSLRSALRRQGHPLSPAVDMIQLSIERDPDDPEGPAALFLHANDDKFISAIRAAGVELPKAPAFEGTLTPTVASTESLPPPTPATPSLSEEAIRKYFEAGE